jgi:Fe-S-cluster containining protein
MGPYYKTKEEIVRKKIQNQGNKKGNKKRNKEGDKRKGVDASYSVSHMKSQQNNSVEPDDLGSASSAVFICKRCGRCCSHNATLALFEWEADRLKKYAKKYDAVIKPAIIAKVRNVKIILQWGLESKNGKCPFLSSKGCMIYKDRPLVCRAFPLITSGFYGYEKMISSECPNIIIPSWVKKKGEVTKLEIHNEISTTYKEMFIAVQKLDAGRVWISDLSRYVVRQLGSRLDEFSGREIGLLQLCLESGLYDEKFMKKEIAFFSA